MSFSWTDYSSDPEVGDETGVCRSQFPLRTAWKPGGMRQGRKRGIR
jgi:hypothetical protein